MWLKYFFPSFLKWHTFTLCSKSHHRNTLVDRVKVKLLEVHSKTFYSHGFAIYHVLLQSITRIISKYKSTFGVGNFEHKETLQKMKKIIKGVTGKPEVPSRSQSSAFTLQPLNAVAVLTQLVPHAFLMSK